MKSNNEERRSMKSGRSRKRRESVISGISGIESQRKLAAWRKRNNNRKKINSGINVNESGINEK
jgi:hypothetical protein